jgi:hypothetical protein
MTLITSYKSSLGLPKLEMAMETLQFENDTTQPKAGLPYSRVTALSFANLGGKCRNLLGNLIGKIKILILLV